MSNRIAALRRRQLAYAVTAILASGVMCVADIHAGANVFQLRDVDGASGFRIKGAMEGDNSGCTVSAAGDVNGDGIDDVVLGAFGADPNGPLSGSAFVVFGRKEGFATDVNLGTLDGNNGFRLDGAAQFDFTGRGVAGVGDVNGDGINDLVVGAFQSDLSSENAGSSYVVFGSAKGFDASFELSTVDGNNGFRLDGVGEGDASGRTVAAAGDINGDGIDDFVVGAHFADPSGNDSGSSYLIFGRTDGFAAVQSLAALDGVNGFRIDGGAENDASGFAIASAGDINSDGIDDLVIGAPHPNLSDNSPGEAYVLFGSTEGFPGSLNLSALDGSNGFRLNGVAPLDNTGFSVAGSGDINGDGVDDLVIGAPYADPNGVSNAGSSYVIFGRASGFPASFNLSSLNGSNGFRLDGYVEESKSGFLVAVAGDINNDGFDDLLIGAPQARPNGLRSGSSYVVYGHGGTFPGNFKLSELDGDNGFRVDGSASEDFNGYSGARAGDINGDGIDDLMIGSPFATPNGPGSASAGNTFILFGAAADRVFTDGFDSASQ